MRIPPLLWLLPLLAGCVAPEDLGGSRKAGDRLDEFTGVRTESIHTSPIGGLSSEMKAPARITLTLSRISDKHGTNLTLTVNYNGLNPSQGGFGWLYISPGESLTFLIDGETVSLTSKDGSQNYREVSAYGGVLETARYLLPLEVAERIAAGKVVKMRLSGQSHNMDKPFNDSNRETFGAFARKINTGEPFTVASPKTAATPGRK